MHDADPPVTNNFKTGTGQLVTTETRRRPQRDWSPDAARAQRRQVRLFARVAVSTETWAKFRALARSDGFAI